MTTVLCTNGLQSKALAVVRSMGERGIRVVATEKMRYHASRFSKYAVASKVYPDPKQEPSEFLTWLRNTLEEEECDVFFPMDDDVMEVVVAQQDKLRQLCRMPVPCMNSYEMAADKAKTMRLAATAGIPHPRTVESAFDGPAEASILLQMVRNLRFPLIIKPRFSSGSRGVRRADNTQDLVRLFSEVHQQYPNPLIQEMIPFGRKFDVCLCYGPDGTQLASFVQREIRNYPIERGPSTVQVSVNEPNLTELATRLMQHLPWNGVVDVEFMEDPRTGEPQLMEINSRFWSSLHLAIGCGVDFPWILYQALTNQHVEPITEYEEGVMGRSLFPGDILHFLSNPNRWRLDPPFFSAKIPDDILSKRDPLPILGFFLSALRLGIRPKTWKFLINR